MPSAIHSVNPELRPQMNWVMRLLARTSFQPWAVPFVRRLINAMGATPPLPAPAYEMRRVQGLPGMPQVPVFIVNGAQNPDKSGKPRPAVLFIHGGGYIAGTAAMFLASAQRMAKRLNCVVVLPDYRLAPETRFPDSLEDNYSALAWMHEDANALGIDPARIAIYGESAGGGHAAALAIAARDRKAYSIAAQVLIYPMLDDRTGSTREVPWPVGRYVWTAKMNKVGWTCHLGVPAGSAIVPSGAVPARVEDLSGLPRTFIGVGSIDLFVDEDVAYAERLRSAGVGVDLVVVPGAFHGFESLAPAAACSVKFIDAWVGMLTNVFDTRSSLR